MRFCGAMYRDAKSGMVWFRNQAHSGVILGVPQNIVMFCYVKSIIVWSSWVVFSKVMLCSVGLGNDLSCEVL